MNETGRSMEPSLVMSPSGRDIDPDEETVEATAENEVMTSSTGSKTDADAVDTGETGADRGANGHATPTSHPPVPLPADEIGKSKSSATDDSGASDAPDSQDDGDQPDVAATAPNGKLDSGRQAVRQAVAATNSWFSARSAKSNSTDEPDSEAGSDSGFSDRDAQSSSFTPSTTSSSSSSSPASASNTGRSLWRDAYASSQSAKPSASSGSASPSGTHTGPSYAPPSGFSESSGSDDGAGSASSTADTSPGTATIGGSAGGLSSYASSVTAAWQNRTSTGTGTKRKREAPVRRSARRQAQLTLARVEPWSVMKFSFVASVVAFVILFVAVAVLYMVLSALGVFDSLQHTVSTITSSQGSSGTNISNWFSASRILGYTGMLGALNIVLITAMSTIGAVVYNLIARTIGGIEVTLRETE